VGTGLEVGELIPAGPAARVMNGARSIAQRYPEEDAWDGAPSANRAAERGRTPLDVASNRGVVGGAAGLEVGELGDSQGPGT
jgi:hypothetical protein